jgi:translation initiation factor eIF-2B subunit delta
VQRVLLEAKRRDKKFRVVVVGAWPWQEAEKMLQSLTTQGVRCTYLLINAVSCIMREVSSFKKSK